MWVPRVRRYFRTIRRLTSGTEWAGGLMTVTNYTRTPGQCHVLITSLTFTVTFP